MGDPGPDKDEVECDSPPTLKTLSNTKLSLPVLVLWGLAPALVMVSTTLISNIVSDGTVATILFFSVFLWGPIALYVLCYRYLDFPGRTAFATSLSAILFASAAFAANLVVALGGCSILGTSLLT